MPSNHVAETVAAVATTVAAVGITVVVIALACSGNLPDVEVETPTPKPTVVVRTPAAPIPGVPAYKVQPYVVQCPNIGVAVRLPMAYKATYNYVVYKGAQCPIVWRNNTWCYQYGNRYYPVVYY